MRSFPSAARQRLAAASVACVVTLGVLTIPFADANDDGGLKHRQKHVQGQIHDASKDLDEASHEVTRATRRLQRAQERLAAARHQRDVVKRQVVAARERDQQLRVELAASEAELAEANADLQAGRLAVDNQRSLVRDNVIDLYTQGDPQLRALGSFLDAESVEDITRTQMTEQLIVSRGDQTYDDLGVAEDALDAKQDRVKAATLAVAAKRDEAARHLTVVRGLLDEARAAKLVVAGLVTDGRSARQDAFAARKHDRLALQRLKGREARIRRQILAATKHDKGGYTGDSGGFLSYPANGPVTSPYGYRVHPIYGYYSLHDGTDFGVPCGTPLHAVADGTVINEYYDGVYGNRLYLSLGNVNGKNMTVVYNHMSRYASSEGQRVSRGDVIGYSGTTGWSTGCHLHFTVLVDGDTVDPMNYL